jgi:predicted amidophosphoribosyltransferase
MLDLLLPQRCLVCGRPRDTLCADCYAALPRLRGPLCARCGAPTAWPVARCRECAGRRLAFASARAAVAYDRGVSSVVLAWKERGLRRFVLLAAELVDEIVPRPRAYTVTFVPADGDRSSRRGHHPAHRLAAELGDRWQLPVRPLLERVGSARPQRGLPLADRRRNVAGAFRPVAGAPTSVILVDDVYTSGATVSVAASALRKAGARRVHVVTFARAVR